MDHNVLKKKLNTFKSSKGTLRQVSNDVVMEVLRAWENWPGSAADLYRELGLSKMQLVTMIQKAKNLVKNGTVVESEFKELSIGSAQPQAPHAASGACIELACTDGKVIRFCEVEQLVEFIKKAS